MKAMKVQIPRITIEDLGIAKDAAAENDHPAIPAAKEAPGCPVYRGRTGRRRQRRSYGSSSMSKGPYREACMDTIIIFVETKGDEIRKASMELLCEGARLSAGGKFAVEAVCCGPLTETLKNKLLTSTPKTRSF